MLTKKGGEQLFSELVLGGCPAAATGPQVHAASLPLQSTQEPLGLVHLCKALSSPIALVSRQASLANPTPREAAGADPNGAVAAMTTTGRRTAVSELSEPFDAERAIAAFERSTSWVMAPEGPGEQDGCIGRGTLLDFYLMQV
ncbi:hypothetical protein VOLCADRAFT_94588 [Volvox carteri f. nagariensis]|uniref:Uncharacterized protein n=1 Tax=Volvox carteri f. nagariensis TaxID=3068 RepID=D8U568_VOLCA|nr:uncharacterized protein VOLCADRAFT_94588 [Volvox carteri f. nagariensis]EFJ45096.1 hypothetical protein VOLCADRAFT_94588 [Volvox carteri f. nagariensis]|eukprot:XP_002953772.1 hypothetical protein VOLCADRAFT_94588 [Volvox carteri f. nagariensis]